MAAIAVWVCRFSEPETAEVGAQSDASQAMPSSAD